jgi:hypothetical protein
MPEFDDPAEARRRQNEFLQQVQFDAGLTEAFGILVAHLAERGCVDVTLLCAAFQTCADEWSKPTNDRADGRAPHRAAALRQIITQITPFLPTPAADKFN